MKMLIQNTITKKILIALVLVVIATCFVAPNEVHASWLGDVGQKLIDAFFQFLIAIGDLIMSILSDKMMGNPEIEIGNGTSQLLYSPGIIFLNKVPGLQVNFVTAEQKAPEYNLTYSVNTIQDLEKILKAIDFSNSKMNYKNPSDMDEYGMNHYSTAGLDVRDNTWIYPDGYNEFMPLKNFKPEGVGDITGLQRYWCKTNDRCSYCFRVMEVEWFTFYYPKSSKKQLAFHVHYVRDKVYNPTYSTTVEFANLSTGEEVDLRRLE